MDLNALVNSIKQLYEDVNTSGEINDALEMNEQNINIAENVLNQIDEIGKKRKYEFILQQLKSYQLKLMHKKRDVVGFGFSGNTSNSTPSNAGDGQEGGRGEEGGNVGWTKEVQVLKSLILGEEERGQSQYQVMCFIFHLPKDSFISSDAMSKLRQKNPTTIRTPEEDIGRTNRTMDYVVVLQHSGIISPHIADLCAEAGAATYARHEDIIKWSALQGIPETTYLTALKQFPSTPNLFLSNDLRTENKPPLSSCTDMKNMWTQCQCHLELCIGWYPCGLKYCKGKGQTKNSVMSYRCGIKTCKTCHLFAYYVSQKQQCLWDE